MEGQKLWRDPNSKDPCDHGWGSYNANQIEVFVTTDLFISIFIIVIRRGFFYLHKVNSEGKSE